MKEAGGVPSRAEATSRLESAVVSIEMGYFDERGYLGTGFYLRERSSEYF